MCALNGELLFLCLLSLQEPPKGQLSKEQLPPILTKANI